MTGPSSPSLNNSILILSAHHVATLTASFSSKDLQSLMAHVFYALSHDHDHHVRATIPNRTAIDMASHRALFMPARIANMGTAIKVVSVPSVSGDNRGLPATTLVLDENTGATKAVINARTLTSLRTAAGTVCRKPFIYYVADLVLLGSVLATTLLYPPGTADMTCLVAFGAGSQIESHVTLLLATYPSITNVTIVNRTINDRITALLGSLRADHPAARFNAVSSQDDPRGQVESAIRQADCVCCATPSIAPLFRSEWVRPGTHIILAGSYKPEMAEVDTALIRRARVLVDSRSACALEAGELIGAGLAAEDMVEVGELLRSVPAGRGVEADSERVAQVLSGRDVTVFKSVGVGAQDVAISIAVVEKAMEDQIGERISYY
jgi:ornithine cyclodeaminase